MTTTIDTAELSAVHAKAQEVAERAQATAAEAAAELARAEDAIESARQKKYRAWCESVVAHRRADEQDAIQRISDERTAFADAVALGDLSAALSAFLAWSEAAGQQAGVWRKVSHALYQVDPNGHLPELSYRHQPASFTEELSKAVAAAAARRNADADDEVQEEIARAVRGEVTVDPPAPPQRPRKR